MPEIQHADDARSYVSELVMCLALPGSRKLSRSLGKFLAERDIARSKSEVVAFYMLIRLS